MMLIKNSLFLQIITLVAMIIPTNSEGLFSGIPIFETFNFGIFAIYICSIISHYFLLKEDSKFSYKEIIISIPLLIAIFLKIYLFKTPEAKNNQLHEGFKTRITSTTPLDLISNNYKDFSFNYPYGDLRNITRYDREINFENELWHFGFINESRFKSLSYYNQDPQRIATPLLIIFDGEVNSTTTEWSIQFNGEVSITANSKTLQFKNDYNTKKTEQFQLSKGNNKISITYAYLPNEQVKEGQNFENPVLKIFNTNGFMKSNAIKNPYQFLIYTYQIILIFYLFFYLAVQFFSFWKNERFAFYVFFIIVIFNLTLTNYKSLFIVFFSGLLMSSYLFYTRKNFKYYLFFTSLSMITSLLISAQYYTTVPFETFGDSMTYEGMARAIYMTDTWHDKLMGFEKIFFYQPFYRYALTILHTILGDYNSHIFLLFKCIFISLLPILFWTLLNIFRINLFIVVPTMILFYKFTIIFVFEFFIRGMSESISWIFSLLGFLIIANNKNMKIGSTLLALSSITRINLLPSNLLILFTSSYFRQVSKRTYVKIICLFFAIYLTIPIHNYFYGNQLVFATSSSNIPVNVEFNPSSLLIGDNISESWKIFFQRIIRILYIDKENIDTYTAWHWLIFLSNLTYLIALIAFIGKKLVQSTIIKTINDKIFWLFLIPISSGVVFVKFNITHYYPRQIIFMSMFCLILIPLLLKKLTDKGKQI